MRRRVAGILLFSSLLLLAPSLSKGQGTVPPNFKECVLKGGSWDFCDGQSYNSLPNPFENLFIDDLGGDLWQPSIPERYLLPRLAS